MINDKKEKIILNMTMIAIFLISVVSGVNILLSTQNQTDKKFENTPERFLPYEEFDNSLESFQEIRTSSLKLNDFIITGSFIQHISFNIDGNTNFTDTAILPENLWPGDGSIGNPYIISDFNFTNQVNISNTDLYFIVNNSIFMEGLDLYNVNNVVIQHSYATMTSTSSLLSAFKSNSFGLLPESNNVTFINNTAFYAPNGFDLISSSNLTFTDNKAIDNLYDGFRFSATTNSNFSNNSAYYINNYFPNSRSFFIRSADNSTFIGNKASNYTFGFYLTTSFNVSFIGNTAYNNSHGFYLQQFTNGANANITIKKNLMYNNTQSGMFLHINENITVVENDFKYNRYYGIYVNYQTRFSKILNNTFIGNNWQNYGIQAWDNGQNNIFSFNHWDDWTSPDIDYNMIVDDPYPLLGDSNSQDLMPRVMPFLVYDQSRILINGNADLISQATLNKWPGNGSPSSPYVLSHFNITGTGIYRLIDIQNTDLYIKLEKILVHSGLSGIRLFNIENSIVNQVFAVNNLNYGFDSRYLSNSTFTRNTAINNKFAGIYFDASKNNILSNNVAKNEIIGFFMSSFISESTNNTLIKNTVQNSNNGFLLKINFSTLLGNLAFNNTRDGFKIIKGINNTLTGNNATNNKRNGFFIDSSSNVTLKGNYVYNNTGYGILLFNGGPDSVKSDGIEIIGNYISNNKDTGIRVYNFTRTLIMQNTFIDHPAYGVELIISNYSRVLQNSFINDNGRYNMGIDNLFMYNYWSTWSGPDADNNSIIDLSYTISGGLKDNYPLTYYFIAPIITLIYPTNGSAVHTASIVTVNVTNPAGQGLSNIFYNWDNDANSSISLTPDQSTYQFDILVPVLPNMQQVMLKVNSQDLAGNWMSQRSTFIIDETAPINKISGAINESIIPSGTLIILDFSDDNSILQVLYNWDGSTNNTVNLVSPQPVSVPSSQGLHILNVFVEDEAHNWNFSSFRFTIDDIAPAITLNNPLNETILNSGIEIDFTYTDLNGFTSVLYNWDGSSNVTLDLINPQPVIIPSSQGSHQLNIYANDSAGNWNLRVYVFISDDVLPVIALNAPLNSSIINSGTEIDFIYSDLNGLTEVLFNWDGSSNTSINLLNPQSVFLPATQGVHILNIFANDSAGNWNQKVFRFVTDDIAPTIKLNGAFNNSVIRIGGEFEFVVEDLNGVSEILYAWNEAPFISSDVKIPQKLDVPSSQGKYTLYISVIDNAGNVIDVFFVFDVLNALSSTPTTSNTIPTSTTIPNSSSETEITESGVTEPKESSNGILPTSPGFEMVLLVFSLSFTAIFLRRRE